MSYVVIVDRTVDPFDPRPPVVVGSFKQEDTAIVKAAAIRRGLDRAKLGRDVYVTWMDPGLTAVRNIVEDAA